MLFVVIKSSDSQLTDDESEEGKFNILILVALFA